MFDYQEIDPGEHARNLRKFLEIAPNLVPHPDWLQKHFLRHPDLSPNNIFVDDDFNITGIIDWQHSTILPLFLHAGIPASLQNYGDPDSEELKKPEYPAKPDELDEADRQKDIELYRRRHTYFYYVGATATKLNTHYQAMTYDRNLLRKKLYQFAAEPWEGNHIPLQAVLVQIATGWSQMTSAVADGAQRTSSCPIAFDEQTIEDTTKKMLEQEKMDWSMGILRDMIGISTDGWLPSVRYDDAVAEAAETKKRVLDYAESDFEREMNERHWMFDDFDEDE